MKKVLLTLVFLSLIFTGCEDNGITEEIISSKEQVKSIRAQGMDLLWNLDCEYGYLNTTDVNTGKLWGWTDNSAAYANISAPIAYYLYKANLKEPALAGFEAMYIRTSNDRNSFSSADIGVFLYAYRVTEDSKYLDLVNDMASNWISKYPSDGFPFRGNDTYWGYDSMNWMRSAYYIKKTDGIDQSLIDWANASITAYESGQQNYKDDTTHIVFMNVSANNYKIGAFTTLNDPITEIDTDDYQVMAYAKIGKTIKKDFDVAMETELFENNGGYSEVAAELVYALLR